MIGLDFYGLVASTFVLIHQVQETREGKVPGSLQLQNPCSVTVVYPVDRPEARSTGDTASGSLEPDENTISPFSLTTAGRPAHSSVDRAHRRRSTCFLQVDRGTV